MRRREFLKSAGISVGVMGSVPLSGPLASPRAVMRANDWTSIRDQFALTDSYTHMATFLLPSHPKPVAEAIERHRRAFDENPAGYFHEKFFGMDQVIRTAAAEYMGGSETQIALTDSTTMGLGLLYGGLKLRDGQEILTTRHDHYSTEIALRQRAERTGAKVRYTRLYENPAAAGVDEIVTNLRAAIRPNTRVFAATWVHSSTGVKLPLRKMADAIDEINRGRDAGDRVLFCVDGVHGFGIEDVRVDELGCDFFMAGTHKWVFGPRGTGVIWARDAAWKHAHPVIPSFGQNYAVWLGELTPDQVPVGCLMTPGGFHSFEHRWALPEAFRFHLDIGKARVRERIHSLNTMAKEGLAGMKHVKLITPMSAGLSAGIICFEVAGYKPDAVVERLHEERILGSSSPYRVSYPRIAPSLINNEDEIEQTLRVIREMA